MSWKKVAEAETGTRGTPGSGYHLTTFTLYRRGERWQVTVEDEWGSNQGYLEQHGSHEAEGRGDTPEEAVEAVRKDVFAWAGDDAVIRAESANALRSLVYQAEDAEHD